MERARYCFDSAKLYGAITYLRIKKNFEGAEEDGDSTGGWDRFARYTYLLWINFRGYRAHHEIHENLYPSKISMRTVSLGHTLISVLLVASVFLSHATFLHLGVFVSKYHIFLLNT